MAVVSENGKTLGKVQMFWMLWLLGLVGVLSLLLVPLTILPEFSDMSPLLVKGLNLMQPLVLLTTMTWLGTVLASKVGLDVPLLRELYEQGHPWRTLRRQLIPAVIVIVPLFVGMMAAQNWAEPHLPAAYLAVNENAETLLPPLTRFFYGGITEEILMRWGLMTLLVWIPWKLFQRSVGKPLSMYMWGAILLTAFLFGMGHLPLLYSLVPQASTFLSIYIVGMNAVVGIAAGWLFWQYGLEAAMMAHILFHILGLLVH